LELSDRGIIFLERREMLMLSAHCPVSQSDVLDSSDLFQIFLKVGLVAIVFQSLSP